MHDYQNHKGRDMEKPSLADRELIEEIKRQDEIMRAAVMFASAHGGRLPLYPIDCIQCAEVLARARDALIAHEQQRSQAAAPRFKDMSDREWNEVCKRSVAAMAADPSQAADDHAARSKDVGVRPSAGDAQGRCTAPAFGPPRSQAAAMPSTFQTEAFDKSATGGPAADPPRDQPAASPADGLVENLHRIAREQRVSKIWTIWLCAAADRIERDAQDASRYRWILGHYSVDDVAGDIGAWGAGDFDTLDAAIDAAMKDKNA